MKNTKISLRLLIAGAAITVLAGLTACSAGATSSDGPSGTPIGGDVVAPLTVAANDLQGATVDLVVGQVLNVTTGDLAVDSYSGEVADPAVAEFIPGGESGTAEMNPGVEAVGVGETSVTMTNSDGGIQDLTFTVVVSQEK